MKRVLEAFAFCPRCGAQFRDKNDDYLTCGACGLKYFSSPKPTAGVVPINEKGELLLTERAVDPHKGKFDVLGGFLKEGETFEQGARREAMEELHLTLGELTYAGSYAHGYVYQDVEYVLSTVIFTTPISGGEDLKVADDIASYAFFDPKNLTEDMLAFPEIIESFLKPKEDLSEA